MLQVAGFLENSTVNGVGMRCVLFVSGCPHLCLNCHNAQMQDPAYGETLSIDVIYNRILKNLPIIDGVTFSGGEPFEQGAELATLAQKLKAIGLNIWCYSGYTYSSLVERATQNATTKLLLQSIDILVDGPFISDLADSNLKYRGSSNQHIYALNDGKITECLDSFYDSHS